MKRIEKKVVKKEEPKMTRTDIDYFDIENYYVSKKKILYDLFQKGCKKREKGCFLKI